MHACAFVSPAALISGLLMAMPIFNAPLAAQRPGFDAPFALSTRVASDKRLWAKWRGVDADIDQDIAVMRRCREVVASCPIPAQRYLAIIEDAARYAGRDRLEVVNRSVNGAIGFKTDWEQWGVVDAWSSPLQTFSTGWGDCEDFAIAKYLALTQAGMSSNDLRLVIVHVRGQPRHEYHLLVAARVADQWWLLDTLRRDIVADADAVEYTPRFAIDTLAIREFSITGTATSRGVGAVGRVP